MDNVFYIRHPFSFALGDKRSSLEHYVKGEKVRSYFFRFTPKLEILIYVKDVIANIYFFLLIGKRLDLCIAVDNLNAFPAILFKRMGRIKKVIYYNIDYTPERFKNKILNSLYQWFDRFACYNSDINWIGTKRTTQARKKNGVNLSRIRKTVVVPDGNHSMSMRKIDTDKIKKNTLVFVGHVLKKQGIDLVIDSIPTIKKIIQDIKLIVIGEGEYLPEIKRKVKRLGLQDCVLFKGYIKNHLEVERIVARSAIGIATYIPDKNSFTNYSEAGKPKLYLGCGLPVVITKVPSIANDIKKAKAGMVINYDQEQFISAIRNLLLDKKAYVIYKNNATELGSRFDWTQIFKKAMNRSLRS